MPNRTSPRSYGLSIPLDSDSGQSLSVLDSGRVAIIQTYPIPPGDYPGLDAPADYQDGLDDDHPDEEAPPDEPLAPDDGTSNIDDDQDPSWYPDGDAVDTGVRNGSDIASDALDEASAELPDSNSVIISAFDPPLATDAKGKSVPVSFAKTSDGVTVSISPSSSAVFPIKVGLAYGFDPDSYDPPASTGADTVKLARGRSAAAAGSLTRRASARASATCSGDQPEVVVSDSSGWKFLTDAFRRRPTTCAVYYISAPPEKGTDLPRGRRSTKPGQQRAPLASAVIKALNKVTTKKDLTKYPDWNDSGAAFTPLAEINFEHITNSPSYQNQTYAQVGQTFGNYMKQRGYKMWSIDEFAKFTTDSSSDQTRWTEYEDLVDNLYKNGSKNGNSQGVIFSAEARQDPKQSNTIRNSKAKWEMLLSDPYYDWTGLSKEVKLWADEDYTKCSVVCVPGSSLGQKAQYTNAYLQKLGRLAFAKDAPAAVAPVRSFMSTRFAQLINGWGAVEGKKGTKTNGYGTYDMSVDQIRKLVGLQVYATRSWMSSNSSYAGDRIGVRWVDRLDPTIKSWDWVGGVLWIPAFQWTAWDRATLAQRIARSIAGAIAPAVRLLRHAIRGRGTAPRCFASHRIRTPRTSPRPKLGTRSGCGEDAHHPRTTTSESPIRTQT